MPNELRLMQIILDMYHHGHTFSEFTTSQKLIWGLYGGCETPHAYVGVGQLLNSDTMIVFYDIMSENPEIIVKPLV